MIGTDEATNCIDIEVDIVADGEYAQCVRAAVIADITGVPEATCLAILELQNALPPLPEGPFEMRMPTLSATLVGSF